MRRAQELSHVPIIDVSQLVSGAPGRREGAEELGQACRGYFRVGDELTSGKPDQKEGLYLGTELPPEYSLVQAGTPRHGPNLFPEEPAELREVVLDYMEALTRLGHRLMAGAWFPVPPESDWRRLPPGPVRSAAG